MATAEHRVATVGNKARVTVTVRDEDDTLTTPTTRVATVKDPAGAVTNPAVTVVSTGVLRFTFNVSLVGYYKFKLVGSGNIAAVADGVVQGIPAAPDA
jgi:hypothetical protein